MRPARRPGVVLDPASPIDFAEEMLHRCDFVLVMSVDPGFDGQDGANASQAVDAGRRRAGRRSAIFGASDYAHAVDRVRAYAKPASPGASASQ
jgi:ribulose-phosphate 3-epimerase